MGAIRSLSKIGWVASLLWCALTVAAHAGSRTETVRFADPRWPAVRVVHGVPSTPRPTAQRPVFRATPANTEIVSFGDGTGRTVSVVRGSEPPAAAAPAPVMTGRVETVRFGGVGAPMVNIVRGGALAEAGLALFGAANDGELDRVAFAVDGAESGHGTNLAMWRPNPDGPQGPMQVSAAAALDVGGGDRFDLRQNRLLGRAYLAKLYRRYGNWPDAIAAYNWGPGNLDQWIANGRPTQSLPLETARYLLKVLRDALMLGPS
ncbi:MAG TPA: lytic transglycosylase domain-containing protein [Stellaceae bacterium]|nr:lytic transglycosylase domain-containing protein [Stellaceae bacterium]